MRPGAATPFPGGNYHSTHRRPTCRTADVQVAFGIGVVAQLDRLLERMDAAADVLLEIALDRSVLPVLDRQGAQMRGPDNDDGTPGGLLFKPVVKASTRANCAEKILGLGGLVPVKRIETKDTTGEELDDAAAVLEGMHPDDQAEFRQMIKRRNAELDGEE